MVTAFIIRPGGTRRGTSAERAGQLKTSTKASDKTESIDVPDLHSVGMGQKGHGHTRHQLDNHRGQQHLLSVESIGHRAGEQAENDEGERLEESGEPQLKGRAGHLVHLVEVGDVADLDRQRGQNAGDPEQPIIADEQGRPRPNSLALSRVLVYFGAVIQSVRKAKSDRGSR